MGYRRPLVMVVEDDEAMNLLERELLSVHGMDTVSARSGNEALEVSRSCDADAVLLDVMLPGMDGFETCRKLRQIVGKTLPIVIVTALDNDDYRHRCIEAGANAYITKPFDPDDVVHTIQELLPKIQEDL